MGNIVWKSCKNSNKEKSLVKLVVKSCLTALRAATEQLSIPLSKLPWLQNCFKLRAGGRGGISWRSFYKQKGPNQRKQPARFKTLSKPFLQECYISFVMFEDLFSFYSVKTINLEFDKCLNSR